MKSLIAVIAILICPSTLWAEHTAEEIDRREVVVGAEYENGIVRAAIYDVILECEISHNIESGVSEQVFLSYPASATDFDTPWRIAFAAKPAIWVSDIAYYRRNEPISPDEYRAGGQYLTKSTDVRVLIPPAYLNGRHLKPLIELRHLHLWQPFDNTEVFARGLSDLEQTTYGIGLSQHCGSLELKLIYNNDNRIDWLVGFSTKLSTLF